MKRTRDENRELCERYPFLIPWNRFSGKRITEAKDGGYWPGNPKAIPEYDYEYTELDNMPEGWQIAFGLQMCEEIRDALIKEGDLNRYRVIEIKEKYGKLVWYDNGVSVDSTVHNIIDKYEELSMRTCIVCGEPATRVTTGWISPFCDECCINCADDRSISIEEWLGEGKDHGRSNSTGD